MLDDPIHRRRCSFASAAPVQPSCSGAFVPAACGIVLRQVDASLVDRAGKRARWPSARLQPKRSLLVVVGASMVKQAMMGSGGVVVWIVCWYTLGVVDGPRLHIIEGLGCGVPMRLTVLMSVECEDGCAGAIERFWTCCGVGEGGGRRLIVWK